MRPVAQHLSALLRRPVPATGDAVGLGTEDAVARLKPGQLAHAGEPALPSGGRGQRPGVREAARELRRRLRERRVRDGASRTCLDGRRRGDPAGLRRAPDGARDPQPLAPARGSRPPVRGGHRRGQGLGQDQGPRCAPRARRPDPHRRRHGQHVPRRAGPHRRQEPARAGARRGRRAHHRGRRGEGRQAPAADRRRRREGGDARGRAQDRARAQDPQLVVGRGRRTGVPRGLRDRAQGRADRAVERPDGRVRGAHLRRWHPLHGAVPGRACRRGRDRRRRGR